MELDQSNKGVVEPSEVVSRYLEAIYYMWSEKEPLRSSRLADWLGVSRPTVAVGLRRMTRDGLVRMNGKKEIELTASGMRTAESIVRRHRIMERWLTDALGRARSVAEVYAASLDCLQESLGVEAREDYGDESRIHEFLRERAHRRTCRRAGFPGHARTAEAKLASQPERETVVEGSDQDRRAVT